ncbi:MAG: hypothetical protein C4522_09435 [Desulfobacteraceae bacterium]|nr:MAG: hypothetical protein C4522_09435 [Desulfobacteraceae bacterium]
MNQDKEERMSDFLKNLRSGQEKQQPRYGNKTFHEGRQYSGNEKRVGADRRSPKHYKQGQRDLLTETIHDLSPAIKEFLIEFVDSQRKLTEIEEVKVKTEEKKIQVFEDLMAYLKSEGLETLLNLKDEKRKKKKVKKPMDANRKKVMQIIAKMRADGETFDKIALYLEKEKLQTFSNRGQWHAQTVHRLYQDHILP